VKPGALSLYHRAEGLAANLPPLLLKAEQAAATLRGGNHRRRTAGYGDSFWQFRPWENGDTTSAIDWRQSARRDNLHIRQQEQVSARSLWFWCADGPSMAWHSSPHLPEKRDHARLLVLTLACLGLWAGEQVALLSPRMPPGSGRPALIRMATHLETPAPETDRTLPAPDPGTLRHSLVILVGDFLDPPDTLEHTLRTWTGAGIRGHLVQVLDPAEENLPFDGQIRFFQPGQVGTPGLLVSRVRDIREAYCHRLEAHRRHLETIAMQFGWTFSLHHTDRSLEPVLLGLHSRLGTHRMTGGPC